jgi:deaminated glutathione amidase
VRIAAAQLDAALGRPGVRDGAAAGDAVARAATEHTADVVLLPEYASGWASPLTPDLVTSQDGPFLAAVRAAAARHGVTVVVGVVLPGPDAGDGAVRARNVTIVVGPDGADLGRYTKTHLYDAYGGRESDLLDAGDPAGDGAPLTVLVPTASGPSRLGVLTCYDLRFPEPFRALMDDDGASRPDVVVLGAAWAAGEGKAEQLRVLARARAIENTVYVAVASQPGDGRTGGSVVVDPAGVVLDEADAADGLTFAVGDVDPVRLAAVRESSPVLTHRRYGVHPLGTDAD